MNTRPLKQGYSSRVSLFQLYPKIGEVTGFEGERAEVQAARRTEGKNSIAYCF